MHLAHITALTALYNITDDCSMHQPSLEDMNAFLNQITLPTLSEVQLASFNDPLTVQEISSTILTLPSNFPPVML